MQLGVETEADKLSQAFMAFNKMNWRYKRKTERDCKYSELQVLMCLKFKSDTTDGMKISDIGRILSIASPTVTQLINSMEAGGMVERSSDPDDRRAVRVLLTEAGDRVAMQTADKHKERINGLVNYLGKDECEQLVHLLNKVSHYFDEHNQSETSGGDHKC
ncbi:MAG: MarR family winged helix-turn-helix transcriptional regulator [Candidatus Pristimantibacillus sp.]